MSLLMDALRKAEEAKKKAAQDAESDEAVAAPLTEEPQLSETGAQAQDDVSTGDVELSMEDMEEASPRSAAPTLDAEIEFEDDEDYVLPSSLGAHEQPALDPLETDVEVNAIPETDSGEESMDIEAPESIEKIDAEESVLASTPQDEVEESREGVAASRELNVEPNTVPAIDSVSIPEPIDLDSLEENYKEARGSESNEEDSDSAEGLSSSTAARMIVEIPEKREERLADVEGEARSRRTARNVFAAKKSPLLSNRKVQIAAGGTLVLLLVAFGTYFYIALNQESTFNIPTDSYVATDFLEDDISLDGDEGEFIADEVINIDEPSVAQNVDIFSEDANDLIEEVIEAEAVEENITAVTIREPEAQPEPSQIAANIQPEIIIEVLEEPVPVTENIATTIGGDPIEDAEEEVEQAVEVVVQEAPQPTPTIEPTNLISFSRQETRVTIDPTVDRAYAAYQSGSIAEAEALYRQALISDPSQRDALLGLATIATRSGDNAEALDLYSRLLVRNPRDPIARAGLMEILPAGRPSEQEADLKRLLSDYPNVAALAYAHGNFLASNSRWSEAQQAYFQALQLAKADAAVNGLVNPDYAFNLAVSLEHLNQIEPAQNYYREALEFASNHPAGFDLVAVRSRLASLAGGGSND